MTLYSTSAIVPRGLYSDALMERLEDMAYYELCVDGACDPDTIEYDWRKETVEIGNDEYDVWLMRAVAKAS